MATRHPQRYRRLLVRLREAREAAGLSQEKVADLIDERQRFLSKVERGERRIDSVDLKELADLYGKPLDYFSTSPLSRRST
jgi:transcriptional regulator with XRE-family HTH domain